MLNSNLFFPYLAFSAFLNFVSPLSLPDYSECCLVHHLLKGTWCSGITSASHAEGPGFKSQCVHFPLIDLFEFKQRSATARSRFCVRYSKLSFRPLPPELSLSRSSFAEVAATKASTSKSTRGGTRTRNLLLRREAPYPLGHTSSYRSLPNMCFIMPSDRLIVFAQFLAFLCIILLSLP